MFSGCFYLAARTSISTSTFLGRVRTATAERAGKGAEKASAYTAFMAAKSFMSARKTVVLIEVVGISHAGGRETPFQFAGDVALLYQGLYDGGIVGELLVLADKHA